MKNEELNLLSFKKIPPGHQAAFGKGTVRVEVLPAGFRMFKLTAGGALQSAKWGVTPWWSPVKPFKEDHEGALGRFIQANMNGVDMSTMVRFMSAVCVDWNDLDNYVEVRLKQQTKAFWGTFAPQKLYDKPQTDLQKAVQRAQDVTAGADLPPDLGTLEAWQLYVPNLRNEDIIRDSFLPAHNMGTLAMHFGVGANHGKRRG